MTSLVWNGLGTSLAWDGTLHQKKNKCRKKSLFKINIDITLPKMPCDCVGLNLQDQMGNHVSDYYGELHKHRLDSEGNELSIESWQEKNENRKAIADRVEKELNEGQGCRLKGFAEAVRVPGNFHISS